VVRRPRAPVRVRYARIGVTGCEDRADLTEDSAVVPCISRRRPDGPSVRPCACATRVLEWMFRSSRLKNSGLGSVERPVQEKFWAPGPPEL
jgi:hypothetical protein